MRVMIGLVAAALLGGCVQSSAAAPAMAAFRDDTDLTRFLKARDDAKDARYRRQAQNQPVPPPEMIPPPPGIVPSAPTAEDTVANIVVTAARVANPKITNTQEADVDEGGIVKVAGDYLVILRRGRLFTVATNDRTMRPVDAINAFPPGTSGEGAWYDEMLIRGDRIVVVGYSYTRGGAEINRFRVGGDGRLRYEDTYHLRSNDYYSSSNYASRLIGDTLVFYTPLGVDASDGEDLIASLPALRRWTGSKDDRFIRIAPATRIFVPTPVRRDVEAEIDTLHTVTTCDLTAAQLACRATGVLGSDSSSFYVSGNAVYVWIAEAFDRSRRALVYRLPLDGSRPGAVQAWGGPVDQFSFREDRERRSLDVVVRADNDGERMWRSRVSNGDAAIVRLPIMQFGDGAAVAADRAYRDLPLDDRSSWQFTNRFVGQHLIYTAGDLDEKMGGKTVFAVPLAGGQIARIRVPHGVDRLDIIGSDVIAIGSDARERLGFSAIELPAARVGDTYFLPGASEGESRSQAFFYRPDDGSADGTSGTLGLPVSRALPNDALSQLLRSGSAITFLRRDARRFTPAGELAARPGDARDDGCQASCVDWYGNARPIFLGDRIFALMGYELVEGALRGGRIGETGRISFAPKVAAGR